MIQSTEAEGRSLIEAIRVELESQYWRKLRREQYDNAWSPTWREQEAYLVTEDKTRKTELQTLSKKIKEQLRTT